MARPRIEIGEHGEIWVRRHVTVTTDREGNTTERVRQQARTQVRDRDGRLRIVSRLGKTKGEAKRNLERALEERADPTLTGVTPTMTLAQLGTFWLEHRTTHGKVRSGEPLAPQSLAAYRTEVEAVSLALGEVRVHEVRVALLEGALGTIGKGKRYGNLMPVIDRRTGKARPRSTRQMRTALKGMLDLAVRHEAISANPMSTVAKTARRSNGGQVEHLTVDQAVHLRHLVRREVQRVPGKRMPNEDLEEIVDLILGTGCRDGEALAIRWLDLLDLRTSDPLVRVCGTLVEPRRGYVEKLHRQDFTKTRDDRTLYLPNHVAGMLLQRRDKTRWSRPHDPVFASRTGNWLNPSNIRTRLRNATLGVAELGAGTDEGLSPHDLRRTVGTLITHDVGLDAARDQLGHSDGSTTYQHYVGKREAAPDLRRTLDRLFSPLPEVAV